MIPRLFSLVVGIWLMAAPAVLGYAGLARQNDRICGPLIATFAITALWEVTRGLRWMNLVFGFWLMLAPLLLHYPAWTPVVNSVVCSLVLIWAAVVPGKIEHRFAGGWGALFSGGSGRDGEKGEGEQG